MSPRSDGYSPELAELVCARIRAGASLNGLIKQGLAPPQTTVTRWLRRRPEFKAAYDAACADRAERARRLGESDAGEGGRPRGFTPELGERVCLRLAEGVSMVRACGDDPELPHPATAYRWLERHEEFRSAYAAACRQRAEALADEALEIIDEVRPDLWLDAEGKPAAPIRELLAWAKLSLDGRRWRVSTLAPKTYGPRPLEEQAARPRTHEEWLELLD